MRANASQLALSASVRSAQARVVTLGVVFQTCSFLWVLGWLGMTKVLRQLIPPSRP
jgi:hypothetical protein